jgi:hypothetical protein
LSELFPDFSQLIVKLDVDFFQFIDLLSVLGQLVLEDSVGFALVLFFEHGDFLL